MPLASRFANHATTGLPERGKRRAMFRRMRPGKTTASAGNISLGREAVPRTDHRQPIYAMTRMFNCLIAFWNQTMRDAA